MVVESCDLVHIPDKIALAILAVSTSIYNICLEANWIVGFQSKSLLTYFPAQIFD